MNTSDINAVKSGNTDIVKIMSGGGYSMAEKRKHCVGEKGRCIYNLREH